MIKGVLNNLKDKYLPSGSFRNNFFTMATGRSISQLIPLLMTPILTRLYTPTDFGVFAIFISIVTVLSLLSNGRYNLAITLPKKPEKAFDLLILCVFGVLSVTLFSFLIIIFFESPLLKVLSLEDNKSFLLFVPIGVLIVALIESVYYWLLRLNSYKFLSNNFVIQTAVVTVFKLGFAFLAWGWFGLIFAHILGSLLSLILLVLHVVKTFPFSNTIKEWSARSLLRTAKEYKEFPFFSLPADGINSIATQLPNLLLNSLFGTNIVGYYSLSQRVLGLPISFVSSAMTDVFRERASADYREKGSCRGIYKETLKYLSLFSIIPFVLLFIFSPTIIPILLGEQWIEAGIYIRILTIMFMMRFIASPLGSTLYINGKQKYLLIWQIVLLVFTILSFYIGNLIGDQKTSLILFSGSYSIMYLILIILGYKFSIRNK